MDRAWTGDLGVESFTPDPAGVDPAEVPVCRLDEGRALMPALGLGTFGSDRYGADDVARAVFGAAEVGYRHFDCAAVYGNEREVGRALDSVMAGGVRRQDLWVTSKLWNDRHAPSEVGPACERSLTDLGVDYLDLYLIHWPFPNYHPPGCDVSSRSSEARPYIHEAYMATWRALEGLVERGLVRQIGTSNMTVPKLRLLLRDASIKPSCNEMELHPHFQQPELFDFCRAHAIQPVGYCPLGSPSRPARDRTVDDTSPMDDPVIVRIAHDHGLHPAEVCLKWALQRGGVAIPFSVKPAQYLANLRAVVSAPLTDGEMTEIAAIDRGNRFIKGQVFLWKEGQRWEDLWDPNDEIPQ
jgi:diketogulonate reductase-like aldo/keto reductase